MNVTQDRKETLKNLSNVLQVTLARIQKMRGVTVTLKSASRENEKGDVYKLHIEPLVRCPVCHNLSLAEYCLYCNDTSRIDT